MDRYMDGNIFLLLCKEEKMIFFLTLEEGKMDG